MWAQNSSEQKYRQLAESISDIFFAMDKELRYIYWNKASEKLTGVPKEDALGRSLIDVFPDNESTRTVKTLCLRAMETQQPQYFHVNYPGGKNFIHEISVYPTEQGVSVFAKDITERKRAEDMVRKSEERLRDIIFSTADWVWEIDENAIYTYSSEKVFDSLAFTPAELIGKRPYDFMPPDEAERVAAIFSGIIAKKAHIEDLENWNIAKNGEKVCFLTNGVPILDGEGNFKGYRGADKDITERKRAEENRVKLEAQLQQSQKMESVGRLAGGVAHDFNNMLGVILGHAEMAMEKLNSPDLLQTQLTEIRNAALRSADLTRQLLAFAREQTIAPKLLDLNKTVDGTLKMLQRLIGENIQLTWKPEANLWPVKMDPSQIDQILANLCVNARDAIAGVGKITIETGNSVIEKTYCAVHAEFVPGEHVMLAVSDDGCGIDKDTFTHIFEPFFTTKELNKGTGLGLSIVYGIVKQNHGFIYAYSEPGRGATFKIYLPRNVGEVVQAETEDAAESLMRGHETILLVEDEPAILSMTTKGLQRQGYTVLDASTPEEAIRLAKDHSGEIHLLITDVIMPVMSGWDLAKKLLALHPQLKCLFMSGYTSDIMAREGMPDQAVHFIQKPFHMQDLAAKVRKELVNEQA